MSKRDRQIVEDYKKIFSTMLQTPHLRAIEGDWYIFEKDTAVPIVASLWQLADSGYSLEQMAKLGWKSTPLLIYKVDTQHTR